MCQTGGASKRWLALKLAKRCVPQGPVFIFNILAVKKTAATLRRWGRWTQVNIPKCGTLAWPNAAWLHRKWAEKTFWESQSHVGFGAWGCLKSWEPQIPMVWGLIIVFSGVFDGTAMHGRCRWNRWDPRFPERYDGQSKGRGESHGGSESWLIQQVVKAHGGMFWT